MNYTYRTDLYKTVLYILLFTVAMTYVESALVVVLRELFYPTGFEFPLKDIPSWIMLMEAGRELATILMLIVVAALAARRFWRRFGFFLLMFGVWDIFYYSWLKLLIGWPTSWTDWDLLFLIPVPWVGPVIAPITVSIVMIVVGTSIISLFHAKLEFRPTRFSWIMALAATAAILYSFMADYELILRQEEPRGYNYVLLGIGLLLYLIGYIHAYRRAAA